MAYTIRITETSPQALSIINMLKTLALDYSFWQISEDENSKGLTIEQEKELNSRYEYVLKNPKDGKTWEEFEKSL